MIDEPVARRRPQTFVRLVLVSYSLFCLSLSNTLLLSMPTLIHSQTVVLDVDLLAGAGDGDLAQGCLVPHNS